MNEIRLGIYRHHKGGMYEVIGVARHSETRELLVIYRALYGEMGLWARPEGMWREDVVYEGVLQPRFAYLASSLEELDAKPHSNQ